MSHLRISFHGPVTLALFMLVACTETFDAIYPTYAEAQAAGAVARGWIPDWLPTRASDIHEAHNIDSNRFMVKFSLPAGTALPLPATCQPVALHVPSAPPFRRNWWPADVPASALATHRHAFFGCGRFFVAYSPSLGEGFVWH